MNTARYYCTHVAVLLLFAVILPSIICPPVKPGQGKDKKDEHAPEQTDEPPATQDADPWEYGLEYERYLKEIFSALEEDESFKSKIMKDPDLKAHDISRHLEFVAHGVRSKLDEIKRTEVERLHALMKVKMSQLKAEQGNKPIKTDIKHLLPDSSHLDITNPHSFEIGDLDKLIQKATKDLDELDVQRKDDFKRYEMEKEHQRREKLAKMSPEQRKKEEEHFVELKKKHANHPKLHEPGSKAQLEEVWEEEDHMDKDSFDPKTFFNLHDIDGDGHLEPDEVEALVEREVAKAYEGGNEEDDLNEKFEEINRMREDMFLRYDTNKDGYISIDEFLGVTKTKDFEEDDGWKGLDEKDLFTDEELAQYEKVREAEEAGLLPAAPLDGHLSGGVEQMSQGIAGQPTAQEQAPVHGQPPVQGQPQAQGQPPVPVHVPVATPGDKEHPAGVETPVKFHPGAETHAPPQHPPANL